MGYVLPLNKRNGMPIPLVYKAGTLNDILQHFANENSTSNSINTIMAQPLGDAPAFCLMVFGSDNRYYAEHVAKRWIYVTKKLSEFGIGVLVFSSDSDPKYNSAKRKISEIGNESNEFGLNGIFKYGNGIKLPICVQDYAHIGTKLRNLLLKTIKYKTKLLMGDYYIQQEHLSQLMNMCEKDKHLLTATALNPDDRQNFDSVLKICDYRVINLLKKMAVGSDATIVFLQIISDANINVFMDRNLLPSTRLEKNV